jgi:hypothetical protein
VTRKMYDSRFDLPPVPSYVPPTTEGNNSRTTLTTTRQRGNQVKDQIQQQTKAAEQKQSLTTQTNPKELVKPALHRLTAEKSRYVKSEEVMQHSMQTIGKILQLYNVDELDALLLSCTKAEREILLQALRKN